MGLLDNFKIINIASGNPVVSITKNGVSFSKATVAKINYPKHVHVMLNESDCKMAIIPCEEDDDSIAFAKDKKVGYVRWNNRDFTKRLLKMINLDLNATDFKGVRIESEYYPLENVLIFDLKDYKLIDSDSNDD